MARGLSLASHGSCRYSPGCRHLIGRHLDGRTSMRVMDAIHMPTLDVTNLYRMKKHRTTMRSLARPLNVVLVLVVVTDSPEGTMY